MSKRYPRKFRDDVVRVTLAHDTGVPLSRIAADFGVGKSSLPNLIREVTGDTPAATVRAVASNDVEARELRRSVKLLEREIEVLRRAAASFAQPHLPGKMINPRVRVLAADGIPVAVTCRVLKLSRQPSYRWLKSRFT